MSDFVTCLRLAKEVFEQYRVAHPKWWKRMDGTPILNDVAVLMAEKFAANDAEVQRLKAQVEELSAAYQKAIGPIEPAKDAEIERLSQMNDDSPFPGSSADFYERIQVLKAEIERLKEKIKEQEEYIQKLKRNAKGITGQ